MRWKLSSSHSAAGGHELAAMDVVGEDAIGLAQHAGIVLQAREERAGLAARIPSQGDAGGEGPGPFLQALDAEELGAEGLRRFRTAAAPEKAAQRPQGVSQGDRPLCHGTLHGAAFSSRGFVPPDVAVTVAPNQMITSSITSQSLLGVFSSSAQANSAVFVKDGAAAKTNDPPDRFRSSPQWEFCCEFLATFARSSATDLRHRWPRTPGSLRARVHLLEHVGIARARGAADAVHGAEPAIR